MGRGERRDRDRRLPACAVAGPRQLHAPEGTANHCSFQCNSQRPPPAPLLQGGMHAAGSNPANPASVAGGPSAIFTAALDRKLRALEEAVGGGLQVAAEVDAGAVITQLVAPNPGVFLRLELQGKGAATSAAGGSSFRVLSAGCLVVS